jgi:hypothetical protein
MRRLHLTQEHPRPDSLETADAERTQLAPVERHIGQARPSGEPRPVEKLREPRRDLQQQLTPALVPEVRKKSLLPRKVSGSVRDRGHTLRGLFGRGCGLGPSDVKPCQDNQKEGRPSHGISLSYKEDADLIEAL